MNGNVTYNAPRTISRFILSRAKVAFVRGAIGSGKSVGCCMKIMKITMEQTPGVDGVRRTRHIVVRNTRDQLKDTTLKTWLEWFPAKSPIGNWKESDRTYTISFTGADGIPIHSEVLFRALDDPDDVAKVLSLEATTFWFNECREIHREIVENAIGRVGRFPSKKDKPDNIPDEQWPTFFGVFGDTNAPEMDSYWYNVFEHLPTDEDDPKSILDCETFSQPPGDSPDAENIENLPPGYYDRKGRSEEWYRTMVQCEYAKSVSGMPVYMRQFKPDRHIKTLKIDPTAPVIVSLDTARTPAAVFKQVTTDGRILTLREAVGFDMGAKTFIKMKVKPILRSTFPACPIVITGDKSWVRQNETDDNSWAKVLKQEFPRDEGCVVEAAVTNDPDTRINATGDLLREFPDGEPKILYDPSCKWLIEGLRSKYRFAKIKGADGRLQERPQKNNWSHVTEADQYGNMFITGKQFDPAEYTRENLDQQFMSRAAGDGYTGY